MWVKICGITCMEDALLAARAGADAIGLNLIASSKRAIDFDTAREICLALRGRARVVGVVADRELADLCELRRALGVDALQLHGSEAPSLVEALLPNAFKVIHIGIPADVERAQDYPGEHILVDTKVAGELGGTGQTFDWSMARELAEQRRVILAGGLTPENVSDAIRQAMPWGVDVATGTEQAKNPRRKDPSKLSRFVQSAKATRS